MDLNSAWIEEIEQEMWSEVAEEGGLNMGGGAGNIFAR